MSSDSQAAEPSTTDAGSSADQYVTGPGETGEFTTDREPSATTPAAGSSNAGINERRANLPEPADDDERGAGYPPASASRQ